MVRLSAASVRHHPDRMLISITCYSKASVWFPRRVVWSFGCSLQSLWGRCPWEPDYVGKPSRELHKGFLVGKSAFSCTLARHQYICAIKKWNTETRRLVENDSTSFAFPRCFFTSSIFVLTYNWQCPPREQDLKTRCFSMSQTRYSIGQQCCGMLLLLLLL